MEVLEEEERRGKCCTVIVSEASKPLEETGEDMAKRGEASKAVGKMSASLSVIPVRGEAWVSTEPSDSALECVWPACTSPSTQNGLEHREMCKALSCDKRFSGDCALKRTAVLLLLLPPPPSACSEPEVVGPDDQLAASLPAVLVSSLELAMPVD